MQGFNKYHPPDFDPRQTSSLNSYRGVHALGKRAKDIDKGILVVRFELPFNIWCGHCNNHLGAGVRYNAQKLKVGNYYTTPIYAFRCKCHLCSGWFEIRTDPKNARYVVAEGARAQEQEWDPEENGGFAVHDTEAPSAAEPSTDAFASLEKSTLQKTAAQTQAERIESLLNLSYRQTSDPYTMSQHLRKKFREDKKKDKQREAGEREFLGRIGWREDAGEGIREGVKMLKGVEGEGREEWTLAIRQKERELSVKGRRDTKGKGKATAGGEANDLKASLTSSLRRNTDEKYTPFGVTKIDTTKMAVLPKLRPIPQLKRLPTSAPLEAGTGLKPDAGVVKVGLSSLGGYGSDSDTN